MFCGRIGRGIGARCVGRNRAVVDDAPAMRRLILQQTKRPLCAQERARQVDAQHVLPLRKRDVFKAHLRATHAGIVEQHIESPKLLLNKSKQRVHRVRLAAVGTKGVGPIGARALHRGLQRLQSAPG